MNQRQIAKLNMLSPEQRVKYLRQINADEVRFADWARAKARQIILPRRVVFVIPPKI